MNYEDLEYYISKPKLQRFLASCGNSKKRALELYSANIKLAESFYPILSLFEVVLRNQINYRLKRYYQDEWWMATQKDGFMADLSLRPSNFYLRTQVLRAERQIRKRRVKKTPGMLVAEQTLGFWIALFEPHHYKLLQGVIIKCFPQKPKTANRKEISLSLREIRKIRNRIYHNEQICFDQKTLGLVKTEAAYTSLIALLSWVDMQLVHYVSSLDHVPIRIKLIKAI